MYINAKTLKTQLEILRKTVQAMKSIEDLKPTSDQYKAVSLGALILAEELMSIYKGDLRGFIARCPACEAIYAVKKLVTNRTSLTCSCGEKFKVKENIVSTLLVDDKLENVDGRKNN